jgi:putative hydrolase of HD superfamily
MSVRDPRLAPDTTENTWTPLNAVPSNIQQLLVPTKPNQKINYILAFIQIVHLLKTQRRTGWVDKGIPSHKAESISDHMYRMSIISMCIPNEKVDTDKCVKIALVHDIAELLVGDITPFGGVSKAEKHRREFESIKFLAELIEPYNPKFSSEIMELWLDYEEIRTLEARYVKDIDKFEMIQQAWDYEQEFGLQHDLTEFYNSRPAIVSQEIGELCDEVIRQRNEFVENLRAQQG